ncbi:MAG TPA: hypothetical protein ENJ41_00305, partial [Oceanospirillales bacterium]|nr:hypothetical protein [Oceanospirillales bacterium]
MLQYILFLLITAMPMVSANMLPPTIFEYGVSHSDLSRVSNSSMYLGEWRNLISNKINPRYYDQLANLKYSRNLSHYQANLNYSNNSNKFLIPVFSDNMFSEISTSNNIYFSFVTEGVKVTPFAMGQLLSGFAPSSRLINAKSQLKPGDQAKLIEQEFYTPGYVISSGNSSFGVGAVLVQQRFVDDSFGLQTFASNLSNQLYNDKAFINTNRGTGYQLNFTQKLPANIDVSVNFRSKVKMNEFDSFGRSYSDSGDFDIPSQYTFTVGMPLFKKNKINFSAEKISYSSVDAKVHSGYSQSFLRVFNSPISPVFRLNDLTVYSVSFEQNINDSLQWMVDITSRQQAPATAAIYNRILNNDTAAISYKIGISQSTSFGEFNLFASFANKPILIG